MRDGKKGEKMLRGGFVGLGRMGVTHMAILNAQSNVEVVAVADKSSAILNYLKQHMEFRVYADYRPMFEEAGLDFVVISTPPDSHAEIVKAALEANLHVFVEKPFTLDPKQGADLVQLAEQKKLINQVGYVNRFNDLFVLLKKLLADNIIGEIKHFRTEMYGGTVIKDAKSVWRSEKSSGGGCMYEYASHCVDLIAYLFGKPDQIVGSVKEKIFSSGVEDLVSSTFVYNKGFSGTIFVNWSDFSFRKPSNKIEILGKEGKILADKYTCKIFLNREKKMHGFQKGWNTRHITDVARGVNFYVRGNEFSKQLEYFIERIERGSVGNIASFRESVITDFILDEIRLKCVEV